MAWRDEDARNALIRAAADTLPEDGAPAAFAELLFGRTMLEDLSAYDAASISVLAEQAWQHLAQRRPGEADIRIVNPALPGGREISVVEIVNDNMPFLFDSIVAELSERGIEVRLVAHPIVAVERDPAGRLTAFLGEALKQKAAPAEARPKAEVKKSKAETKSDAKKAKTKGKVKVDKDERIEHEDDGRESLIHIHIDRIDTPEDRQMLADAISSVLADVRRVVADWQAMRGRLRQAIDAFKTNPPPLAVDEIAEANQLLQWLIADNFVLLGAQEVRFDGQDLVDGGIVEGSGLGILRDPAVKILRRGTEFVVMTPEIREFLQEPTVLIVTKANVKSRVHHRVHMDYIGIKLFSTAGVLEGELRIVGLFTSAAYTRSVRQIPYLRHKVAQVLARAAFDPESNSGKALLAVLESYPRDELFQIDVETLLHFALDIVMLLERPRLRVLARPDRFDRFVSVLVFVPRDKFDSMIERRIGAYLATVYKGRISATYLAYPEGSLARAHYIVGRYEGETPVIEQAMLEAAVSAIVSTWGDNLKAALAASTDGLRARILGGRYAGAFSAAYQEAFGAAQALIDIGVVERLSSEHAVAVGVYRRDDGDPRRFGLKVFAYGTPLALSYRVPVIENHGLKVVNERTYRVSPQALEAAVWLHDMTIETGDGEPIDITPQLDQRLEASLMAVVQDRAESDGYNALTLRADLGWRDVAVIRALSLYLHQIRAPFSQSYMWTTLRQNLAVVTTLVELFRARLDPRIAATVAERAAHEAALTATVETELEAVTSLDQDRILRRFLNLIQATIRTNLWQLGADGQLRPTIAFKFDARRVEGLPAPQPLYEIFVYSPRVEGIHLRFGKVARGGLRWSDRPQDFRTEILGLVKAQQVKNAVIVPVGAKGGFVPKRLPPPTSRDAWLAEGTEAYRIFVRTLLELTDDIEGDHIVPPENTLRHEGDDPYLVVAADKGTATFSDTANALAAEAHYWLGDAFASGGSQGYDHKKMGITARGAWEAVKRHFRELGTDIQTVPFTVAGVGDMSGDVFGNGMLLSPAIRLVAAFDHRDIFLDPAPDPAASLAERSRLFALPRSSWQDYDKSLVSAGGGVFPRGLKAIPLSTQARALLDIDRAEATPFEVMGAILKARVDLLWFGGIGTYIRASTETDDQAGDRANDAIRITGADVRAKVIGEGANLGVTQRGRIEAAFRQAKLNTDAIDNSAGVNTSDVEVNIKIALSRPERDGRLPAAERGAFLAAMTDEVGKLVLRNNYLQTLALSLVERRGAAETGFLARLMQTLEARNLLDRSVEFLPDDAALIDRTRRGLALTRPELAVLMAYAKLTLYDDLLTTGVPDDPYLARELTRYFPPEIAARFPDAIESHRLRREIIATAIANAVINRGGPTAVVRLADETGADLAAIALAFVAVVDSFGLDALNDAVDALDAKVSGGLQLELYGALQDLLLSRAVWFVRNVDFKPGLDKVVARFKAGIAEVSGLLDTALPEEAAALRARRRADLEAAGVPADLAARLADLDALGVAPDIILVGEETGCAIPDAAATHFAAETIFRLDRIAGAGRGVLANDYFERLAIDQAIDRIAAAERRLVADMLSTGKVGTEAASTWLAAHPGAERIRMGVEAIASTGLTLAKLTVAANLLGDLVPG